jgi:hypothetical protein
MTSTHWHSANVLARPATAPRWGRAEGYGPRQTLRPRSLGQRMIPTVCNIPERAMAGTCTVDAALFDNLKQAVEFVAERGGGVVYTELAGTKFAENLKLPDNVQLKPRRVEEEQAA